MTHVASRWPFRRAALKVLLQVAAFHRRRLKKVTFIGVTGTCGKTSTKELIAALLGSELSGTKSAGSRNELTQVAKVVLRTTRRHSYCVIEVATWGPGTVARAAKVVAPDIAVVTNIGPAHLESLGSLEAVAGAKAELIASVPSGGTVVVPEGEELLAPYLRDDLRTVTFGENGNVRQVGDADGRFEVDMEGQRISLEVPFDQLHLRQDLLAAIAACAAAGVTPHGRVLFEPLEGRGQRFTLGRDVMLIDDSYNANPVSMGAALDDLARVAERSDRKRRVAVLGDMLELGADELRFHRELGQHANAARVDVLITVGPLAKGIAEGFSGTAAAMGDANEAAVGVASLIEPGDVVLVKGSRGVHLETVCAAICSAMND